MKYIKFKKNKSVVINNTSLLIDWDGRDYMSYCLIKDDENKRFINPIFKELKSEKAAIKSCLRFLKKYSTLIL